MVPQMLRSRGVLVALVAVLFAVSTAHAEEKVLEVGKWYPTLESGFTLTQSAYSDNWSGGDKGSIVWTFITNGTLENQVSKSFHWNNTLKLAYGQTHQQKVGNDGERFWERPEKSTDLIDFETVGRLTYGWVVDPFFSGRFESQFQDASDPLGRTITFNPKRFKESAGIARQIINEEDRTLLSRVGFTFRQTSRKLFRDSAATSADLTESTNDGGIEWVTDYATKLLDKRVTWTTKLSAYKAIFYSAQDEFDALKPADLTAAGLSSDLADFTKTVDVDWENILSSQITKLLSVSLYLRFVYDKYDNSVVPILDGDKIANVESLSAATRKAVQIKQTIALGLTYRIL